MSFQVKAIELFSEQVFHASIQPDLPDIVKLIDYLGSKKVQTLTPTKDTNSKDVSVNNIWTVAAQTHSLENLKEKMVERSKLPCTQALLLVSGGKLI